MSAYSQSQTPPNQMPAMNQNYQNNLGYGQSTGNIQPNQYGPSSNQQYPGYNNNSPYQGQYQGQSNQQTYHGQVGQNNQQTYQSYNTATNKMNVPK